MIQQTIGVHSKGLSLLMAGVVKTGLFSTALVFGAWALLSVFGASYLALWQFVSYLETGMLYSASAIDVLDALNEQGTIAENPLDALRYQWHFLHLLLGAANGLVWPVLSFLTAAPLATRFAKAAGEYRIPADE